MTDEKRKYQNEYEKKRYREDEEYHEKRKAYQKEYAKRRYHENKEYRENKIKSAIKYKNDHREYVNKRNKDYYKRMNDESYIGAKRHYLEWTSRDIEILVTMKKQGKKHKEIASCLGRTVASVASRCKLLRDEGFNGKRIDI